MKYAYETLLRLYPDSYRLVFGQEMTSVFALATEELQPRGVLSYTRFLWMEFFGLIAGAFAMWTDEYMSRSRRKLSGQFIASLVGGAAITVFFHNFFYIAMSRPRPVSAQAPVAPPITTSLMLPLIMAGGVLLFFSVFSVAFVWNMRMIGNRSGRLKPIWMPGRAVSSRPARGAARVRRA
jgi:hypothetical protein